MARITPPSLEQLAVFSGREEESYTDFADQALVQATVLFQIASCLDALPTDTTSVDYDVCVNAILDMADRLYLGQQYSTAKASPFSSETIGSYSYSKMSSQVSQGLPTGVGWFDLAIQNYGSCDSGVTVSHSATSIFEDYGISVIDGRRVFLGPEGENLPDLFQFSGDQVFTRN